MTLATEVERNVNIDESTERRRPTIEERVLTAWGGLALLLGVSTLALLVMGPLFFPRPQLRSAAEACEWMKGEMALSMHIPVSWMPADFCVDEGAPQASLRRAVSPSRNGHLAALIALLSVPLAGCVFPGLFEPGALTDLRAAARLALGYQWLDQVG